MSSSTWTPRAVESESRRTQRQLWRAVEAQHIASTLRLVGGVEEQAVLEAVLEASKPALPPGAIGLHYLLATPFRYSSPVGSRFRAPADAGIWYGAETARTACAELGYWRWRFLQDSEGLTTLGPAPQTVLRAGFQGRAVDLTEPPFRKAQATWTDPHDYGGTQAFARVAREARVDAIRYQSVRDPEHAAAFAVLNPRSFKPKRPLEQQSWFLTVRTAGVVWQREGETFEFPAQRWPT